MKRIFLILFLITQVGYSYTQPAGMKPGVERWPVKTSIVSSESVDEAQPVTLSDLFNLPEAPGVGRNDRRYQDMRIPPFQNPKNLSEGEIISVEGWLHLVAWEPDGDYHMQISADVENGDSCLIAEMPYDNSDYVSDVSLRSILTPERADVNQILGRPPSSSGTVLPTAVYVRVTGELFYDDSHVGQATARGKKGMHAVNLWEIHPVTSVEVLSGTTPFVMNNSTPTTNAHTNASTIAETNSNTTNPQSTMLPIPIHNTLHDFLLIILLASILGMAGQVVRLMVGLKKANQNAPASPDGTKKSTVDLIDGKQLAVGLFIAIVIGAIAGVLAVVNNIGITQLDKSTIFVFLAAGYAGTDIIEGFIINRPKP
jgi:hypothetical protein